MRLKKEGRLIIDQVAVQMDVARSYGMVSVPNLSAIYWLCNPYILM